MSSSCRLASILLIASSVHCAAQQIAYDGFGGGPAPLGGSTSGSGWTSSWVDVGSDPSQVVGVGLDHTNLATTAGAVRTPAAASVWPSTQYQRSFSVPPGANVLYVSFLLRADSQAAAWGGLQFGQYPYGVTVGSPLGCYGYGLMTSQGIGDVSNIPLQVGQTVLLVAKIVRNTPGGLVYHLFVDPVVGASEPAAADATLALAQVAQLPSALALTNSTAFTTDEIRVGTSWSAVLPSPPSFWTDLGFAKPGVAGAPHLAGSGPMQGGSANVVTLTQAAPLAPQVLVGGVTVVNAPLLGGILVPEPLLLFPGATDGTGSMAFPFVLPNGLPAGLPLCFQTWIVDAAAGQGFAASNGLRGICQ